MVIDWENTQCKITSFHHHDVEGWSCHEFWLTELFQKLLEQWCQRWTYQQYASLTDLTEFSVGVITLEMLVRMLVMGLWKYLGPKFFQKIFALHFFRGSFNHFVARHHRDTFNIYKFINLKSQQSNASDISRIYIYIYASGGSIAVVGFSIQSACCIIFKHNLIQPLWFHRCLGFKQFSAILRQKRNISQPTSPQVAWHAWH